MFEHLLNNRLDRKNIDYPDLCNLIEANFRIYLTGGECRRVIEKLKVVAKGSPTRNDLLKSVEIAYPRKYQEIINRNPMVV
ncbi:hypothetical protein [Nostoc phage A1]|nr:hypothetical protein [Nostoc phage A1]